VWQAQRLNNSPRTGKAGLKQAIGGERPLLQCFLIGLFLLSTSTPFYLPASLRGYGWRFAESGIVSETWLSPLAEGCSEKIQNKTGRFKEVIL
jgi:hypothetical protein